MKSKSTKIVNLHDFIRSKEKPDKSASTSSKLIGKSSGNSFGLSTLLHFNHNDTLSSIKSKYGHKSGIS